MISTRLATLPAPAAGALPAARPIVLHSDIAALRVSAHDLLLADSRLNVPQHPLQEQANQNLGRPRTHYSVRETAAQIPRV